MTFCGMFFFSSSDSNRKGLNSPPSRLYMARVRAGLVSRPSSTEKGMAFRESPSISWSVIHGDLRDSLHTYLFPPPDSIRVRRSRRASLRRQSIITGRCECSLIVSVCFPRFVLVISRWSPPLRTVSLMSFATHDSVNATMMVELFFFPSG